MRASDPCILAVMLLEFFQTGGRPAAFRAGARGIFSRHDSLKHLKCILSVCEGQIWPTTSRSRSRGALASSPVVRAVDSNGLSLLSKREIDVVRSWLKDLQIVKSPRAWMSQHTIKNYFSRL